MKPDFGVIFLIILATEQIYFVSGMVIKVGIFHILHRHTESKRCAIGILKENLCVGGAIEELTGGCECLNHSWGRKPTIQGGYAYMKKVWVKESFNPPINYKDGWIPWTLPGVFREGSKVEVTVSSDADWSIHIVHNLGENKANRYKHVGISYVQSETGASVGRFGQLLDTGFEQIEAQMYPLNFTKAAKTKISFMSLSSNIWILVDDHKIIVRNVTMDLAAVEQIRAQPLLRMDDWKETEHVHSFGFSSPLSVHRGGL